MSSTVLLLCGENVKISLNNLSIEFAMSVHCNNVSGFFCYEELFNEHNVLSNELFKSIQRFLFHFYYIHLLHVGISELNPHFRFQYIYTMNSMHISQTMPNCLKYTYTSFGKISIDKEIVHLVGCTKISYNPLQRVYVYGIMVTFRINNIDKSN